MCCCAVRARSEVELVEDGEQDGKQAEPSLQKDNLAQLRYELLFFFFFSFLLLQISLNL